ncbi:MAG: hypothetical protein K9L62_02040 [Vallitaleaceae bacterium]|nr:hypothetical protein [Vallitaleaceae bacterium]
MRNRKLDKINRKSFNSVEFIKPAQYLVGNYVIDSEGYPLQGARLQNQIRYAAEFMKVGEELSKTKWWLSGVIVGVVGTFIMTDYFKSKENSEKSEEA